MICICNYHIMLFTYLTLNMYPSFIQSLKEAYGNARSKDFSVVRFENKVNSDQPYYELLEAPWSEVKDDPRYKEASPVVNDFCSRAHHKRMRLLTIDEYNALKPGLEILHASSSPSAVEDDKGNLLHLGEHKLIRAPVDPPPWFLGPLLCL